MTIHNTDLVRKASAEELCGHRARAMELYGIAVERLKDAMDAHQQATRMGGRASLPVLCVDSNDRWGRLDEFVAKMQVRLDRDIWRGLIVGTPIGSLMDKEERKKFEDSLEKDPPPATVENVRATLERLMGESDMIFRRGLVNAFKRLDRDYASNDGFKIGDRVVMTWGCSWDKNMGYFTLHHTRGDELRDVDRVMHVLDGKPSPDHGQGLGGLLHSLCYSQGREALGKGETPYWRVRLFKNGNIHLWPLRADLVQRANKIIAEHYGMVVPASREARKAEPDYKPKPGTKLDLDFFASPAAVAARAVELASVQPGMKVLEPSAGEGAIVAALNKEGANVWAYEIDPDRRQMLVATFFNQFGGGGCACRDFLEVEPERTFDRVVMNPPFSQQQDMRHVCHALKFLKPGGRLVAIMGSGWRWRTDRLSEAFRRLVDGVGGTIEELPKGSFKESGTEIDTFILTIDLPRAS